MAVELHPAVTQVYGDGAARQHPFASRRAAEAVQAFDPIHLTRIPAAIVSGTHVISGDGTVLGWGAPDLRAWRPIPRPPKLEGTHLHLGGRWSEGYAHWLLDVLPRLHALPHLDRRSTGALVAAPFPAWKAQSLAAAGIDPSSVTVLEDRPTEVETLYVVGPIGSPAHCHPLAVSWLRTTYLQPGRSAPGRRLYVTRRAAASRRLRNEDLLLRRLEPLGFEVIDPGQMAFDEQVAAFQGASMVIGPHGAGLANLVFCPPGTGVVELCVPGYPQLTYEWISSLCELRYRPVPGRENGSRTRSMSGRQDFDVDPVDVVRSLDELDATS
jgi:capsular polysaccharide biosynthesis protein